WSLINTGLTAEIQALTINQRGTCIHSGSDAGSFSLAQRLDSECLPPPPLLAAVLPTSRSVQVGAAATAFASVTNASFGNVTACAPSPWNTAVEGVTCGITQLTGAPTPFTFQATDRATNQPIGSPNTPVNIAAGANQTFVISVTPTAVLSPTEIQFGFNCT